MSTRLTAEELDAAVETLEDVARFEESIVGTDAVKGRRAVIGVYQQAARDARTLEALRAENARLREEVRQMRECPMILCPFEEENARLRAELSALKGD